MLLLYDEDGNNDDGDDDNENDNDDDDARWISMFLFKDLPVL